MFDAYARLVFCLFGLPRAINFTRMIRAFLAVPLMLVISSSASAAVCRYENLMPAFLEFERQTKDLAPDQRAERFADDFALHYREFYLELGRVEGDHGFPSVAKLRKNALGLLDPAHMEARPGFPPLTQARLDEVAQATGPAFDKAQIVFLRQFPDFRCPDTVTFGPSFLHFDGHVYQDKRNRQHMLFGVDAIALTHRSDDLPALFEHELFHIYHYEVQGKTFPKSDGGVWWPMWEEGLATYVSQRLNTELSPQQVLVFPTNLVSRMHATGMTQRAARLMLSDFDKPSSQMFDAQSAPSGLPPRAGYYMGYELAARLGRDHSLDWLTHLPPARVKMEARKFLESESH